MFDKIAPSRFNAPSAASVGSAAQWRDRAGPRPRRAFAGADDESARPGVRDGRERSDTSCQIETKS